MNYCFGVDIGGTTVKMGIFKFDGETVDKWEIKTRTENKGSAILPDVAYSVAEKLKEHAIPKEAVLGIGVGVPAPVSEDGIVNGTANLGWEYKEVKHELEELTGIKVKVGNDANVAALGEMWKGGGQGCQNGVMVTLGTGVGGGVVHDQKIVAGRHGLGGEIGHIHIREGEKETCNCGGHGCLEQVASATGIAREARRKMAAKPDASVMRAYGDAITAKNVLDAAKAGDALALEVMDTVCYYLGWALATISMTVDPEIFVIGGGVSKAGTFLTDWIDRYYRELTPISENKGEVRLATLGNDAGIYGAARLILD